MQSKAIAIVASAALVAGGAVISSQVIGADAVELGNLSVQDALANGNVR